MRGVVHGGQGHLAGLALRQSLHLRLRARVRRLRVQGSLQHQHRRHFRRQGAKVAIARVGRQAATEQDARQGAGEQQVRLFTVEVGGGPVRAQRRLQVVFRIADDADQRYRQRRLGIAAQPGRRLRQRGAHGRQFRFAALVQVAQQIRDAGARGRHVEHATEEVFQVLARNLRQHGGVGLRLVQHAPVQRFGRFTQCRMARCIRVAVGQHLHADLVDHLRALAQVPARIRLRRHQRIENDALDGQRPQLQGAQDQLRAVRHTVYIHGRFVLAPFAFDQGLQVARGRGDGKLRRVFRHPIDARKAAGPFGARQGAAAGTLFGFLHLAQARRMARAAMVGDQEFKAGKAAAQGGQQVVERGARFAGTARHQPHSALGGFAGRHIGGKLAHEDVHGVRLADGAALGIVAAGHVQARAQAAGSGRIGAGREKHRFCVQGSGSQQSGQQGQARQEGHRLLWRSWRSAAKVAFFTAIVQMEIFLRGTMLACHCAASAARSLPPASWRPRRRTRPSTGLPCRPGPGRRKRP